MTVLANAVAIGDNQLIIDAPLSAGQIPGWVKIDSELLRVGGQHFRTGTTLVLSEPATATHSQGATVTYAGNPFDADFLSATGGGGGAIAVDNTVDPPAEVTTLIAAGATISGDEATLAFRITATGNNGADVSRGATVENGAADARSTAEATGTGNADARTVATVAGPGDADAKPTATAAGAGNAFANPLAQTVNGDADVRSTAVSSGSGDATAGSAATANSGNADAQSQAVTVSGTAYDGIKAVRNGVEASLVCESGDGYAGHWIVGLPTADPVSPGQLWLDVAGGRVLKVSAG